MDRNALGAATMPIPRERFELEASAIEANCPTTIME
jgi:hypothetical protein